MNQEEIEKRVRDAAPKGRIACSDAFRIAEELKIPVSKMGKVIQKLDIKIVQCQLGCF